MDDIDFIVVTATEQEQQEIRSHLQIEKTVEVGYKPWTYGRYRGYAILLIVSGIGTVNTAHAVTIALERHTPRCVIQVGIGGAYVSSGLKVGDIALAENENYGDMGVQTVDGWHGVNLIGIPLIKKSHDGSCSIFNSLQLDRDFVNKVSDGLINLYIDQNQIRVAIGPFVTVQQCSGVQVLGDEISTRFNGICENMEGAAAAHICCLKDIAFLEIRCISNMVINRDLSKWDIPMAISRAQSAVEYVLSHFDN
jgi:futalosine hydrolase